MSAASRLDALAEARPEWRPWLRVVREVLAELSDPAWDAAVPERERAPESASARTAPANADAAATMPETAPWLASAVLRPDARALARLLDRLIGTARAQGLHALSGDRTQATSPEAALAVFLAAVNSDSAALDRHAASIDASPTGFRALARLLPMPSLHACARRRAAGPGSAWSQGYCPVCGEWPAFAEVRGIERTRQLRCGGCGAGWPMQSLACTYCASTDHETLGSLVVDDRSARCSLDVCRRCSGYLKSTTTLQPTPSDEVLVADLGTVEFDLAAVERGFLRPQEPGVVPRVSLASTGQASPAAPRRWW